MATPAKDAECRYHEALATLIKDMTGILAEKWDDQPREVIQRKMSAAISNALRIAI